MSRGIAYVTLGEGGGPPLGVWRISVTLLQLESWGAGSEWIGGEGVITRGSVSGAGGAGAAGATLGGRDGANLVCWTQGCMGPSEERVFH